jgi:hypothetical protein
MHLKSDNPPFVLTQRLGMQGEKIVDRERNESQETSRGEKYFRIILVAIFQPAEAKKGNISGSFSRDGPINRSSTWKWVEAV